MSDIGSLSHCSNLYLGVFSICHFGSLDTSNLEPLLFVFCFPSRHFFLLVSHIRKIIGDEEIYISSLGVYDDVREQDARQNRTDAHTNIEKSEAAYTDLQRLDSCKTKISLQIEAEIPAP